MAHLTYLNQSDLPEGDKYLLEREINLDRIMVHSLPAARIMHELGDWIRFRSTVDPRIREIMILQVGYMVKNAYETSHHVKIARDFGVSKEDLNAIVLETKGIKSTLPNSDRQILKATREIVTDNRLTAESLEFLKRQHSEAWIVEFVVIIGFYKMMDTFITTLGVDVEESWAIFLKKMPLV